MYPKIICQHQNLSSSCIWRDLELCYLSNAFLVKYAPDKLICLFVLNLKISITKVTGVSLGTPRLYAVKSQNDVSINRVLKTPTQQQMIRFLSIFVHIQSLCFLLLYISPK